MSNKKYIDIRVIGNDPEIKELLELLAKMEYLGDIGANRTIPVVYDGDGSGDLHFEAKNGDNQDLIKQLREKIQKGYNLNMDKQPLKDQVDGDKMNDHYIGE